MGKESIFLASQTVEIAEHKTYLELLNRVCYYDYPNLNGAELPSENALDKAQTLIDMPVKAKYTVNMDGLPTFKGHEAYVDEDGEIAFDTEKIGTHTDVYVADDAVKINGQTRILPCLFAKQKIWTDNKNVVAAIRRLHSEGRLHNSWELIADEYQYSEGVRKITDYTFTSNVYLGYEFADPAYGESAKAISLSSKQKVKDNYELLIAESLSKDLIESRDNSDKNSKDKEERALSKKVNTAETVEPVAETVAEDFDVEITETNAEETAETVVESTESVDSTPVDVEETETEEAEVETEDSDSTETLESLANKVAELSEIIINLNSQIQTLTSENEKLTPYKEQFEKAEMERIKTEQAQKREVLKTKLLASKVITEKDIEESEDIQTMISSLDEVGINALIVEKIVGSTTKAASKTEVAEKKTVIKTDITSASVEFDAGEIIDHRDFISAFIGR